MLKLIDFYIEMGNESSICCDEKNAVHQSANDILQIDVVSHVEPVQVFEPELNLIVDGHLKQHEPFAKFLPKDPTLKRYGNSVFKGVVDEIGRPTGYGTMIHEKGSVFVGYFMEGKAHGPGHFVWSNGDYFNGDLVDNLAQQGIYHSKQFKYEGQFKNNLFSGKGKETTNHSVFKGIYEGGKKVEGILSWKTDESADKSEEIIYEGAFDSDGLFSGKGVLQNQKGIYTGEFQNGEKHGKGQFEFKNGLKYVGQYKNGLKEGSGTIYRKNDTIAYSGEFKEGVPNGKGYIITPNKEEVHLQWIEGLDSSVLPLELISKIHSSSKLNSIQEEAHDEKNPES